MEKTRIYSFTADQLSKLEKAKNAGFEDPFKGATMKTVTSHMNYAAKYTDIMLYKRKF